MKKRTLSKNSGISLKPFISQEYWKKQKQQQDRWAKEDAEKATK